MEYRRLDVAALFTPCDAARLGFESTTEIPDLDRVVGHARALDAIRFGVGIRQAGFNLYALGPSASGRHSIVQQVIEAQAANEPVPPDYCYVNNFDDAHKPRALELPAGMGTQLRADMVQLVAEFSSAVPGALESDEYQARLQEAEERFKQKQEEAFVRMSTQATELDVRLLRTPAGFAFAPVKAAKFSSPKNSKSCRKRNGKRSNATSVCCRSIWTK